MASRASRASCRPATHARLRALLLVTTGCGRIEFDLRAENDAMIVAVAADSMPDSGACAGYAPGPAGGSRYRADATLRPWFDAERSCEVDGAHLVVIDSVAERDYIAQTAASFVPPQTWIGLTDHVSEGLFRWISDQPLTMPAWAASEPNNAMNNEDCVHTADDGTDNDNECTLNFAFICECDATVLPTPPTWCDTTQPTSCGTCGNACAGSQVCTAQACI